MSSGGLPLPLGNLAGSVTGVVPDLLQVVSQAVQGLLGKLDEAQHL